MHTYMVYECNHSAFVHTCSVMKPGEAVVCLCIKVTAEDADAHTGLVVGLVGILLGILLSHLRRHTVVVFALAHGAIVASSVYNRVWLIRAKCRPKTSWPCMESFIACTR